MLQGIFFYKEDIFYASFTDEVENTETETGGKSIIY